MVQMLDWFGQPSMILTVSLDLWEAVTWRVEGQRLFVITPKAQSGHAALILAQAVRRLPRFPPRFDAKRAV